MKDNIEVTIIFYLTTGTEFYPLKSGSLDRRNLRGKFRHTVWTFQAGDVYQIPK